LWKVGSAPALVRGEIRPSGFARWVLEQEPEAATFIDVGCGAGADVHWLAQNGRRAVGLDFLAHHYRAMARRCRRDQLPASFRWTNLCEHRSVLATATELSRLPGPRVVLARHVADATDRTGRENLIRLGRLLCRSNGRLYLQVQERGDGATEGNGLVQPLEAEKLMEAVRARRGTLVERLEVIEDEPPLPGSTVGEPERGVTRWVISWAR
jgi:SAM-dependent methyltransferase